IVLIPDVNENRDKAWELRSASTVSWPTLLQAEFPEASIYTFGYNTSTFEKVGDLVETRSQRQVKESNIASRTMTKQSTSPDIRRPIIFVAHGYGGLIYEQALVGVEDEKHEHAEGVTRKQAAILLNTPHHGAGLAEWAVICAKELGIPCAPTPQEQDWSLYEEEMNSIDRMQRSFRQIIRRKIQVRITGCYAVHASDKSKLSLAPEWAILPDFHPIPINSDHFGMTTLSEKDSALERIAQALKQHREELIEREVEKVGKFPMTSNSRRWALLICADRYAPGNSRLAKHEEPEACAQDTLDLEEFLSGHLDIAQSRIKKLISGKTESPTEEDAPTYHNIMKELGHIIATAAEGDHVYIHYSGALARRPNPGFRSYDINAKNPVRRPSWIVGLGLVLSDILTGGPYLTDYQLSAQLELMSAKGLHVLVVLDGSYQEIYESKNDDSLLLASDARADRVAHKLLLAHKSNRGSLEQPPPNCTVLACYRHSLRNSETGLLSKALIKLLKRYPTESLPPYHEIRDELVRHDDLGGDILLFGKVHTIAFGDKPIDPDPENTHSRTGIHEPSLSVIPGGSIPETLKSAESQPLEEPHPLETFEPVETKESMILGKPNMLFTHNEYTVAWICALPLEMTAAYTCLDKLHPKLAVGYVRDNNLYTLGEIAGHNVAIASLPFGKYGESSATRVGQDMLRIFPNIRLGLMVGIGAGAPSNKNDIRLGDVVVSAPDTNGYGGVFQYDFGELREDGSLDLTKHLNKPPPIFMNAIGSLFTDYEIYDR
ncbi:hypothetical protein FSPOR_11943, partial [Fusarium sporotrichioides]